jgi:SAM-dependent methyltransferase
MDWDTRYATEGYFFGKEPADFLIRHAALLPEASSILCVADGEGRNSVYLAGLGHHVTAFDPSPNAVAKARALAQSAAVEVDHRIATLQDWDWSQPFDVLAAIFIQFLDPDARTDTFATFRDALPPGGLLLLHGYAPRQVDYGTGGPPLPREHVHPADAGGGLCRLGDPACRRLRRGDRGRPRSFRQFGPDRLHRPQAGVGVSPAPPPHARPCCGCASCRRPWREA